MDDMMNLEPLQVESSLGRDWVLLTVRGELDILTSPDLAAILGALVRGGRSQVTVDVSGVRFVDAHGLRVLADCARTLLDRGTFVLACPSPSFRRLLEITDLDRVIPTSDVPPTVVAYHLPLRF